MYPGAAPSEVEPAVSKKIESAISTLENLESTQAISQEGVSIVTATLLYGTDVDMALQEAQRKVNSIKTTLPDDVKDPSPVSYTHLVVYKRQDYQRRLQDLNTESIRAGYLHTLSFIANMRYQSQTHELYNRAATQGFGAGLYGLRLSIPIFDGFAKKSKITQSQYAVRQLELNRQYLTRNVENQFTNARNTVIQNGKVLSAQDENMKPVSYAHLDVYKRQLFTRRNRKFSDCRGRLKII